ncbi:MAG: hypothetical protein RDU25_02955 [Patescibacteria group bacterium]|nr:hypothetical protein [Patescibacteria group bacterium]
MENQKQEAPPTSTLENVLTAICAVTSMSICLIVEMMVDSYMPEAKTLLPKPLALTLAVAGMLAVFVSLAAVGAGILHLFEKPGPRTVTF